MVEETGIVKILKKAGDRIAEFVPLGFVHVIFRFDQDVIPETGDLGMAPRKGEVYITVDPKHRRGVARIVREHLPKILAHELHHAARWETVGYGTTLLEALVTEGLATQFEDELYPKPKTPWGNALTAKQTTFWWKKAKWWLNKKYDHYEWFFGTGKIPRWTGYTIGYRLVGNAMKNLGKSAAELVNTPAEEILRRS